MTCNVIFKGLRCQEKNNNEKENVQRKILRIPNYMHCVAQVHTLYMRVAELSFQIEENQEAFAANPLRAYKFHILRTKFCYESFIFTRHVYF